MVVKSLLMKHIKLIVPILTAVLLLGCSHTPIRPEKEPPAWFQIQPGMTREKVHTLLGEPQSSQAFSNEEGWKRDYWNLTVTYDNNGIVTGAIDYKTPGH